MSSLRQELAASARLRLGLVLITGILGFYGLLEWQDHQGRLADRYKQLSAQHLRLSTQQALSQWPQRAQDAQSLLPQYERRLWRQPSFGLAQAALQDWLRQQLRAVNAQNAAVKVAEADAAVGLLGAGNAGPGEAGLTRVGAQVEFANSDPQLMLALLASMAAHEPRVFVDGLSVKPQRIEIRVSAWFRLAAPDSLASTGAPGLQQGLASP